MTGIVCSYGYGKGNRRATITLTRKFNQHGAVKTAVNSNEIQRKSCLPMGRCHIDLIYRRSILRPVKQSGGQGIIFPAYKPPSLGISKISHTNWRKCSASIIASLSFRLMPIKSVISASQCITAHFYVRVVLRDDHIGTHGTVARSDVAIDHHLTVNAYVISVHTNLSFFGMMFPPPQSL